MSKTEFFTQALSMPESDRAELAKQLLLSLEPAAEVDELDEAWIAEIEARIHDHDEGRGTSMSWEQAAARIRQALVESRAS